MSPQPVPAPLPVGPGRGLTPWVPLDARITVSRWNDRITIHKEGVWGFKPIHTKNGQRLAISEPVRHALARSQPRTAAETTALQKQMHSRLIQQGRDLLARAARAKDGATYARADRR